MVILFIFNSYVLLGDIVKYFYKYKYLLFFIGYMFLLTIMLCILNLFCCINTNLNNILCCLGMCLYALISNVINGKNIDSKAYKVGLYRGLYFIIILYILNGLVISFKISINTIIYYLLIVCFSLVGSIIGINKKKH